VAAWKKSGSIAGEYGLLPSRPRNLYPKRAVKRSLTDLREEMRAVARGKRKVPAPAPDPRSHPLLAHPD
jgi:hypothetical protein